MLPRIFQKGGSGVPAEQSSTISHVVLWAVQAGVFLQATLTVPSSCSVNITFQGQQDARNGQGSQRSTKRDGLESLVGRHTSRSLLFPVRGTVPNIPGTPEILTEQELMESQETELRQKRSWAEFKASPLPS